MTNNHESAPQTSDRSPATAISPERHRRLCVVCRHPDRHWIEEAFLHWRSPQQIAIQYKIPDRASIYRHARALGLFALRERKALERSRRCARPWYAALRPPRLNAKSPRSKPFGVAPRPIEPLASSVEPLETLSPQRTTQNDSGLDLTE